MRHLKGLLSRYCRSVASPLCLDILRKLDADDWDGLVRLKASPQTYTNPHAYLLDAQAVAFFSKNASVEAGIDTSAEAKKAWWEAEHRCARTNAYISSLSFGSNDPQDEFAYEYLIRVRKKVTKLMGSVPSSLTARFGPGSTLTCQAKLSTLPDKIDIPFSTTEDAAYLAKSFLVDSWWFRSHLERGTLRYEEGSLSGWTTVRSSRWSSVPKNAKTDRSIEIGPDVNIALQLDVGSYLTQQLARQGWTLKKDLWTNAQNLHKQVACDASRHGFYATIDLKQASDSVSQKLVEFLVTPSWYALLDSLRTRFIRIDGKDVRIQKFSGMGNGFTFELESIIFAAFAMVALEDAAIVPRMGGNCFVFGDDIIVPSYCSRLLISSLKRFGFEVNVDKTFTKGPFRESCGGDYFRGVAVRPFFLKEAPHEPAEWIVFANGVRNVGYDNDTGVWRDPAYLRLWLGILDAIPADVRRLRGPSSLGDLVIHDERDRWITKTRNCRSYIRSYRPKVDTLRSFRKGGSLIEWGEFPQTVVLATRLYSFPQGNTSMTDSAKSLLTSRGVIPRGAELKYRVGWTPLVSW